MIDPITPNGHWTLVRKDHLVWAIPFSLAATKRVSVDFFSSGYLDVSVLPLTSIHKRIVPLMRRVSPFGNPRLKSLDTYPGLIAALLRPSSASGTKAFPICP